jgi:hypothetical protein
MSKYVRKFWFEGQLALALGVLLLLAAVALADPIPIVVPNSNFVMVPDTSCIEQGWCMDHMNDCMSAYSPANQPYAKPGYDGVGQLTNKRYGFCLQPSGTSTGSPCKQYEFYKCAEYKVFQYFNLGVCSGAVSTYNIYRTDSCAP